MKQKQPNFWHSLSPEEAVEKLSSDMYKGLSCKEAARRRRACGQNTLWRVKRASVAHTALGEFLDIAAILLIITAVIAALFDRGDEAVVLALILIVSASVRTLMYVFAQRIFEEAARTNLPQATVLRDGKIRSLAADNVVPGDILILTAGDPAVADARLLAGNLIVYEAGVTENRAPVKKSFDTSHPPTAVCESRDNILFAGSTVLKGNARAIAIASGEDTYFFAKRGPITIPSGEDIPILSRLSGWCRNVSLVMIAVVLLITLGGVFVGKSDLALDTLFLSALSLAVASMSEFLCVIAAIILAVSMQKLKKHTKGTVVLHASESIEQFAQAKCIVLEDSNLLKSGSTHLYGAYADGRWMEGREAASDEQAHRLFSLALLCRAGALSPLATNGQTAQTDELTEMLRSIHRNFDTDAQTAMPAVTHTDCDGKLHTALTQSEDGCVAYICGDVADVLSCCTGVCENGQSTPLTESMRKALIEQAAALARRSLYTVAVASRVSLYADLTKKNALQTKMLFLGFFAVANPIESSLALLVEKCKVAGISVVILSTSAENDRTLLTEAGLLPSDSQILKNKTETESFAKRIAEPSTAAENVCVFVQTLSARTELLRTISAYVPQTVYVADSLSSMPLCRSVSSSVAVQNRFLSAPQCLFRAADAAVHSSDDVSAAGAESVIRIIASCRGALIRLSNAAEYLLTVQALRLTLMLAAAFFGLPLLTPVQALWWGLVLDFSAVLTLAFADTDTDMLLRHRREMEFPSLRRGMLFPLALGTLGGILLSLCAILSVKIVPGSDMSVCMHGGGVLASFFLLSAILFFHRGKRSRSVRLNAASIVYSLLTIATLLFSCRRTDYRILAVLTVCAALLVVVRFLHGKLLKTD